LLGLLDLIVNQPAGEPGARARYGAETGIAANGAENGPYSGIANGPGQRAAAFLSFWHSW
jgi:hypothetical protein